MSHKKTDLAQSLEGRQRNHKFLTTQEVLAWNATRGLRPQSSKHWMSKARELGRLQQIEIDRLQRMRFLASGWKRLAQKQCVTASRLTEKVIDRYLEQAADTIKEVEEQVGQVTPFYIEDQ